MDQEPNTQGSMIPQVLKSMLGGILGASVGVLAWFIFDENSPKFIPYIIGALGIAAGVGLTLPGVSAKRVSKGVVAGIVAKPLPGPLRGHVVDAIMGDEDEQAAPPKALHPPPADDAASQKKT
jgi:hypothetical protein